MSSLKSSCSLSHLLIIFCFNTVAVCDLVFAVHMTCLDHPQRAFDNLYRCANFGWNQCSSFKNMHIFRFCELGLKHAYSCPKNWAFLGIWLLEWRDISTKPPKVTSLHGKSDAIWHIDCQNWSTGATVCVTKRPKEKRSFTVAKWVFAKTTHIARSKSNFAWWMVFGS